MSQGSVQISSRFTLQCSSLSLFKDFLLVSVQSVERLWNLHVFMGVKLCFSPCSVCASWYRAEWSQRDKWNLPREEAVQMVAVLFFFFFLLEPGNRTGYLIMLLLMLSNWHTDYKLLWKCMRLEGVLNVTEIKWFKRIEEKVVVSFSLTGEQWFSFVQHTWYCCCIQAQEGDSWVLHVEYWDMWITETALFIGMPSRICQETLKLEKGEKVQDGKLLT